MPRERTCDFCDADIEPGTGTMFVETDGTTTHFCSSKCEKNADLGRESRDLEWADRDEPEEQSEQQTAVSEEEKAADEETTETAEEETGDADADESAADETDSSEAEEEAEDQTEAEV